MSQGK